MVRTANAKSEHVKVVQLLLEHGARPDARDLCGKTIIHYCTGPLCMPGTSTLLEIADLCIARAVELNLPKLVDVRDRFGGIPLLQAIMCNRADLVAFLCKKNGADVTIKDFDGADPQEMVQLMPSLRSIVDEARNLSSYKVFKGKCNNCQATNVETHKCGKCRIATYCSRDCQVR